MKVKPYVTGSANALIVLDGVTHQFFVRVKRYAPDVERIIMLMYVTLTAFAALTVCVDQSV